jgi:stage V sporulation protein B
VGLIIKLVLNYTLVGIPEVNVMGAGTGTLVCYICITVFSLYFLCREAKVVPNFIAIFLKPLLASVVAVGAAFFIQKIGTAVIHTGKVATLAAIAVAGVLYIICMLWFRALKKSDLLMLPKGQKIVKILEKHNWIS